MAIVASAHVLLAGLLLPAAPSVVRLTEPPPVSGIEEVAETTVVPVVPEVMTPVQLAFPYTTLFRSVGDPTKLPGPLVILAVAVPLPSVVPTAVTVMVSVWLVPTALAAVAGVRSVVGCAGVLRAGALLPAVPFVVRLTEPPVGGVGEDVDYSS